MMEKLLIIEDDETARNQLSKVVAKEGFQVFSAATGAEGLEIFHREMPDIIITDLKIGGVDGMEILHTVKRLAPPVQVILVTAFGDYDTVVTALREGALDYLKKPIDLNCRPGPRPKISGTGRPLLPTILIVEDEETTRIRQWVRKAGKFRPGRREGETFQAKTDIAL